MVTANQAYEQAQSGEQVIGWKLQPKQRQALLERFPPRYTRAVADHVTLRSRVAADAALPEEDGGEIIGRSDDGQGVEAMVVRIRGTSDRPDGVTYHVTWSLGLGREARESNAAIRDGGWTAIEPAVPVRLLPAAFPRSS